MFWRRVTEAALIYGPLFFELSAHAMQDLPHTEALKGDLISVWLPPLIDLCVRAGIPPEEAPAYARLGLAASRGLLFDLLLTGDRVGVDEASALLNRLFSLPARVGVATQPATIGRRDSRSTAANANGWSSATSSRRACRVGIEVRISAIDVTAAASNPVA